MGVFVVVDADFHPFSHLVHILLGIFNYLNCFLPFLLEGFLGPHDLFFFESDPLLKLLLFTAVRPWRVLLIFEHFLDEFVFFLHSVLEGLLSHRDQIQVFVIFHYLGELCHSELLE
jgi:hypothetical protein